MRARESAVSRTRAQPASSVAVADGPRDLVCICAVHKLFSAPSSRPHLLSAPSSRHPSLLSPRRGPALGRRSIGSALRMQTAQGEEEVSEEEYEEMSEEDYAYFEVRVIQAD